tara:strand:+ start:422 stop:979 length:558 start_codon:yes stop_codon:yes gene_type:complete
MGLKTRSNKEKKKDILTKREKIAKLQDKHLELFKQEGVKQPKFIPRMCYKHEGELIVSFYPSEIEGGVDLYTEFVSRDYEPEDPERRLWKWVYNDSYETEYPQSEPHPSTGDRRFLIPIDELIEVEKKPEVKQQMLFEPLPDADADVPFNSMTLRDYAAIQWKVPVSHKKWLNNLINDLEENKPF